MAVVPTVAVPLMQVAVLTMRVLTESTALIRQGEMVAQPLMLVLEVDLLLPQAVLQTITVVTVVTVAVIAEAEAEVVIMAEAAVVEVIVIAAEAAEGLTT